MTAPRTILNLIALVIAAAPVSALAKSDCAKIAGYEAALAKQDFDAALGIEQQMNDDTTCLNDIIELQKKRVAAQVAYAETALRSPTQRAAYERMILMADQVKLSGKAALKAGDVYSRQKKYAEAADAYERALTLLGNSLTPAEIDKVVKKSYQAKTASAKFVSVGTDRDGSVAGSLRATTVARVPLPIQFDYDRADLTPSGQQYATELAEALKEQKPAVVVIEGHTDSTGSHPYNMDLSERRAETVARYLAAQGVTATIKIVPKGKTEPFTPVDAHEYSAEQIAALNRRVVWRRDQSN